MASINTLYRTDIFASIKQAVKMADILNRYSIQVNRAGFAVCPFHNEGTASLKVYPDSFYCFGCGAGGDVISFTAKLFSIDNKQAALRINNDFALNLFTKQGVHSQKANNLALKQWQHEQKQKAARAEQLMAEYNAKTNEYRKIWFSKPPTDKPELMGDYAATLGRLDYLDYYFGNFTINP